MLIDDVEVFDSPSGGHGGARENAGRKKAGYKKSQETLDFEAARARNEAAKASLNELDYKVKSGEYLPRDIVRQVSAQACASISQSLRGIPDTLERKGVPPETCQKIGEIIDAALDEMANEFEMMTPRQIGSS